MAAVPRFKLKQTPTDVWSTRERLCLASSVMRSGDQNWMSVSRAIRPYGEPNRPADWFSQKNCALQYSDLLEKEENPKRKRGERGEIETPGESIVRKLTSERIEELKKLIIEDRRDFYRIRDEYDLVQSGRADNRLREIWQSVLEEKRQEELKAENHKKWLQDRELAKQAASLELRNRRMSTSAKPPTPKRASKSSDYDIDSGGEPPVADSTMPDLVKEEQSSLNEVGNNTATSGCISSIVDSAISIVPTSASLPPSTVSTSQQNSPLLNTLLRSSTHVSQSTLSSPKDSCMMSPITSLRSASSTIVTSSTSSVASLLSTALSNLHDSHDNPPTTRSPVTSPSQGAPTLLKLLDMPLGAPGKLPPLPVFSSSVETFSASSIPVTTTVTSCTTAPIASSSSETVQEVKPVTEEEVVDVVVVQEGESVVETTIDVEHSTPVDKVTSSFGSLNEDKVEVKEMPLESEEVASSDQHKEELETVVEFQQVPTTEEIYTEEVVTEVIDETSNIITNESSHIINDDNVVEVLEIDSTTEDVTTTVETSVVPQNEVKVEAVEVDESKEQNVREETTVIKSEISLDVHKNEASEEKSDNLTKAVKQESDFPFKEESSDIPSCAEEIIEDNDADKTEEFVDSFTADESDSMSKLEEKTTRRKTRTKKWALGISDRGSRRTSNRMAALQSSGNSEESIPEAKVEQPSSDLVGLKKSLRKDITETPKNSKDQNLEEQSTPTQTTRPRRSNARRTFEKTENTPTKDPKGKLRNRRHFKPADKEEDEAEDDVKTPDMKKVRKVETIEDSKENSEKEDNVISGTEILNTETEEENKDGPVSRSSLPNDSVPNSPASTSFSGDDPESIREYKVWKKAIMLVWRSVANHKYANVFLNAVTEEMAPGYQSVVYRPMDLATVKKNIENQTVRSTMEFQRDVLLIFQNAIMYNSSDHDVYKMAVEMQQEVIGHIQDFVATQIMVQSNSLPKSLRRETRDHALKTRESMEKSLLTVIQDNDSKRKRPASESDVSNVPSKRRRTRANDES